MASKPDYNLERSPSVISIRLSDQFYEEFQRQLEDVANSLTPDQLLASLFLFLGLSLLSSQSSAEDEQDQSSLAWNYLSQLQKEFPEGKGLREAFRKGQIQLVVNDQPIDLTSPLDLNDPLESFKRGWDDAMNGRVMSFEDFERRMNEDVD